MYIVHMSLEYMRMSLNFPHVVHSFPQCKYSSQVESYSTASRILDGSQVIYSLIFQISHIILYQKDKEKIHFIKNVLKK